MDVYRKHELETQRVMDEKFKEGNVKNLYIPEILEGLSEITSFKDRVAALRNNSEISLNTILHMAFRDERPLLTKDDVLSLEYNSPFKDDDYSVSPSSLYAIAKRLYIFYRPDITKNKMKLLLLEMLENLHEDEAKILIGVFTGDIPYPNITKKLVASAFPDLWPEGTNTEEDAVVEVKSAPKAKPKKTEKVATKENKE